MRLDQAFDPTKASPHAFDESLGCPDLIRERDPVAAGVVTNLARPEGNKCSGRHAHARAMSAPAGKPTLVGLKENQRINPMQSKLPRQRVSHHPAEVHACPTVHSAP